jgi:L-serine/L-threonine ammonia-lyase
VAEKAFENTQKYSIVSHLVNDETSCRACVRFADEHRVLVEPACGASLSVVYDNDDVLGKYRNIVVIVCGGSKVDLDQIAEWRKL